MLPPCIIFKGKNYIASWFDDLPSDWRIETSLNGWTTDEIGIRWLQKLFIPATTTRTQGKYRLLILDGHGSHLTPQFDQICEENDIMPICMPSHSSHLLQPLDIRCFAVLKRLYSRLIESQTRLGHNHIDKLDFLESYILARQEAFKTDIIQSSFASAGLVPINAERVLSKLNISLTPTPPASRPSSRSSVFTPKTPYTAKQLAKQASLIKRLLRQRSTTPGSPTNRVLDQLIKGCHLALQSGILLAEENRVLRKFNEKKRQKRTRSNRQIERQEGLTVAEFIQQESLPVVPTESIQPDQSEHAQQPTVHAGPTTKRVFRCSGCNNLGHRINKCPSNLV